MTKKQPKWKKTQYTDKELLQFEKGRVEHLRGVIRDLEDKNHTLEMEAHEETDYIARLQTKIAEQKEELKSDSNLILWLGIINVISLGLVFYLL